MTPLLLWHLALFYINNYILPTAQSHAVRSTPVKDDPDILPLINTNTNSNNDNDNDTTPTTVKEMRVDDLYQYALIKSPRFRHEKDARKLRRFLSTQPLPKWEKKKKKKQEKKGGAPDAEEEGLKQKPNAERYLLL